MDKMGTGSVHSPIVHKQDMPPPGGYREYSWARTYPKTWMTAPRLWGLLGASLVVNHFSMKYQKVRWSNRDLEQHDLRCASEPFMKAERDRRFLAMVRKARELEDEVMSDVPGWRTGTWYGEPVFYTTINKWWDPNFYNIYAHSEQANMARVLQFRHRTHVAAPKWYDKYLPDIINERVG